MLLIYLVGVTTSEGQKVRSLNFFIGLSVTLIYIYIYIFIYLFIYIMALAICNVC